MTKNGRYNLAIKFLVFRDWGTVFETDNINKAYDLFLSKFQDVFDQCCPIKKNKSMYQPTENHG